MPSIFLVDDNQLMRQQAVKLVEQQDCWTVSGEAANGKDAVSKYPDILPDVTIMDFEMPEMNGLEAARAILRDFPNAAILMLSIHLPGQLAVEARKVGIKGACPKKCSASAKWPCSWLAVASAASVTASPRTSPFSRKASSACMK